MPSEFAIRRPRQSHHRKRESLNLRKRSINRINEEIYEKSLSMTSSLKALREAKERLRSCIQEVIKQEDEVRENVQTYKEHTAELEEAAQDINNLYTFDDKEQTLLNLHTTLALENVSLAQKQIKQIVDELETMSPIVKDPLAADPNASALCYDQITIPEPSTIKMTHSLVESKTLHQCSICMENDADCMVVGCGHVCMCQSCLAALVNQADNPTCPICRSQFNEIFILELK